MAIPVAALALQMMASAEVGLRCRNADVSTCSTAGAEELVTLTPGSGLLRSILNGRFGPPSTTLAPTFLADNAAAWGDLEGSALRDPPPEVDRMLLLMPNAQVAGGAEVKLNCPPGANDVCDAWVFFYQCASCDAVFQFGVTGGLPSDGWTRTHCAPHFVTGVPSGYLHEMKSFRKKLAPGETATVTVAVQSEFVFFGVDVGGVDCSKLTSEPTCTAATDSACVWSDKGECVPTQCRRGGKGPPPPCKECPWQGIEDRAPEYGPWL